MIVNVFIPVCLLTVNKFYNFSCSHGMKQLSDEEIIKEYGASHKWPLFNVLQEKVYHGGYEIF